MHLPGYLAKVCREPSVGCGRPLRLLAQSTDLAVWLSLVLAALLLVVEVGRDVA